MKQRKKRQFFWLAFLMVKSLVGIPSDRKQIGRKLEVARLSVSVFEWHLESHFSVQPIPNARSKCIFLAIVICGEKKIL